MQRDDQAIERVRARLQALAKEEPELVSASSAKRLEAVFDATAERDSLREASVGRPPKDEADRKGFQTAIRMTADDVEALDELAKAMSDKTGLEVSRAAAMRLAIKEGLAILEEKYLPKKPKK
jgi:uroporphyrinogen-III synthase